MSCYTCENCINGNYNNCKNNAIGGKVTIPGGTILAVYTVESDSNYYLFRESSCPQVLTKDTTDDWGITYGKRSKIVHGCYFDEPENFYHSNCWIKNVRLFQLRL